MNGLTDYQQFLLEQIKDGKTTFNADIDSGGDLLRFQSIADDLLALRDAGLITIITAHKNTNMAQIYYDLIAGCQIVED